MAVNIPPDRGRGAGFTWPLTRITFDAMSPTHAAAAKQRAPAPGSLSDPRFDWRRIVHDVLVSRALDDLEETTNRNRASVPREHLVLYQFSARGHDVCPSILRSQLTHPQHVIGTYYPS